jgi:cation-transporting P-type ATPase E
MTASARAFRQEKTPLQRDIDLVVRIMVLIVVLIGGPVVIDLAVRVLDVVVRLANESLSTALENAYSGYSAKETVRAAAVVVAIVPQGLALMIVVTYAAAAIRLIGEKALVQQTNAIESLSHVDLLCLDKTGTLTTNRLKLVELHPIGIDEEQLARRLGDVAASMADRNRTAAAIAEAYPRDPCGATDEIPFSSDRKWSAISLDQSWYCLGAPDVLAASTQPNDDLEPVIEEWTARGRRVLLFTAAPADARLRDGDQPRLPAEQTPLGLIALEDELRPEARETLAKFSDLGVAPKIISGDDPRTVAALATQAGFPGPINLVSGPELEELDDEAFAQTARMGTIFGRTTPKQKERLVQSLRDQGKYVAMTGDGVNDVLAMKRANLAISFRSGSPAARGVADLVLLNDSFAALPPAFSEGQRILGGMGDVVGLFLIRSLAVTAVILGATLAEAPFPLTPKHNSLLAFFALGVPTLALATWARPRRAGEGLLRVISPFVIPAVLTITPVAMAVYLSWWRVTDDMASSQAALTVTLVSCGLLLIPFVRPPAPFFVTPRSQGIDQRVAWLTAALFVLFLAVVTIAPLRDAFELARLTIPNLATIALVLIGWTLFVRWTWRSRWFERSFALGDPESTTAREA